MADGRRRSRRTVRPTAAVVCALACPSCGEVTTHVSRDAATDAINAPPDAALPPAACALVAPGAVALHLRGSARSMRDLDGVGLPTPPILTEELDLYLPEGRVAGGRAILAFSNTSGSISLVVAEGRFNADLSTAAINLMGVRTGTVEYSASFPAGDAPITLSVRRNLETVSDIANFVRAQLTLCPGGATPEPRLGTGAAMTPTSALTLIPGTPFGAGTETIRLLADGVAVPTTIERRSGTLLLTPTHAIRPNTQLVLDPAALRDAIGRPYVLAGRPTLLRTTATVTDWTFATPPPAGAIAGNLFPGVVNGALRSDFHYPQPFRAVIALGAPPPRRPSS